MTINSLNDLIKEQTAPGEHSVFRQMDATGESPFAFGEIAKFYGKGCQKPSEEHVIVDYGGLQGSNESHGDGVRMNDGQGVAERGTVIVDCRPDLPVRDVQPAQGADYFLLGVGTPFEGKYIVKRKIGSDPAELTLLCVHSDHSSIRHLRRNG